MAVFVRAPGLGASHAVFPDGSAVRDVLNRFVQDQGGSSSGDFFVLSNGRLVGLDDAVQPGAVYHLQPRLRGGKGGFGSMLRALGAQIEKTTNREACRDLSGRRLRDVNHEKEMAEWLKQQAEREAEKEQRRAERLQRKLAEPKHLFSDTNYQQQCSQLAERLEDSVIKGLQASCSSPVVSDVSAVKRPHPDHSEATNRKRKKTKTAFLWTGVGELLSSEEEEEEEEEPPSSSSSSSCGAAAVCLTTQEAEPEQSSSSTSADRTLSPPPLKNQKNQAPPLLKNQEDQGPPPQEDQEDQGPPPQEDQGPPPQEDQGAPPQARGPSELPCSAAALERWGLEALKAELALRGLKCGGTLAERAARLFSVRNLQPDQIDPALLARPAKTGRK